MYGSSSTINTRTPRCYELAHIGGVSKTAYGLTTRNCLDWRAMPRRRPARTAVRRRRALLGVVLALLLAATTFGPARQLVDDKTRSYLSTDGWPRYGQGAYVLGDGQPATLMAILLPSANNLAVLVARQVSGSVGSFVAEMNRTARALGMSHTTYTDPSGYDDGTVSTALDQLRLAQVVAKDGTLSDMMATRTYWLPVAGEVSNTNTLLGHDGFVGMKTGSDEAAGGCLMFRSVRHAESANVTLIGVVLGQPGHNLITAGLSAAKQLVDRLAAGPHHRQPLRVRGSAVQ
jgi:hypothetical protein